MPKSSVESGTAIAGLWRVVVQAHLYTERGDRIQFHLLRNGRQYKWYGIPTEPVRSKKAAWEALQQYAASKYPGRLVMPDS